MAYRKAIAIIKSLKTKIESVKDVNNLFGIGTKIKAKIVEILETGKLMKATILQVIYF